MEARQGVPTDVPHLMLLDDDEPFRFQRFQLAYDRIHMCADVLRQPFMADDAPVFLDATVADQGEEQELLDRRQITIPFASTSSGV